MDETLSGVITLLAILAIVFVILMFKFKGKALIYREELKRAKSLVRIEQNRYLKTMKNTVANQKNVAADNSGDGRVGIFNGDLGSAQIYGVGSDMIENLALAYRNAQDKLNQVIKEYNIYISKFPNFIFAAILRYKKEHYIDEGNLDITTELSDLDTDSI